MTDFKITEVIKRNKIVFIIIFLGSMLLGSSYYFLSTVYVNVIAPPPFLSSQTLQYRVVQVKLPEITYNYYYSDFQKAVLKYNSLSVYQDFAENENGSAIYLNDFSSMSVELNEGRHFSREDIEERKNTVMISEALLKRCEVINDKKYFYFDGEYYEVVGIYKAESSLPDYYINMFAEKLSHNIFNGYIYIDGDREEINSFISSIKSSFSGKDNGIEIQRIKDYTQQGLVYLLRFFFLANTMYTLIMLIPLMLLFLNINKIIKYSLHLRYNELYSRFISGCSMNKIRRQLAFEIILLSIAVNFISVSAILLFKIKNINVIYFTLYSLCFYILILLTTLKQAKVLDSNQINKKTVFNNRSILIRSCKFFGNNPYINFILIMLMVIICFITGLASHNYIILEEVERDINNIEVYGNLYSIVRLSEVGNYNLNTINSEGESKNNRLLYKFLEDNYMVYSCYPTFESEEELLDGKVINRYYYNQGFKKNIMQEFSSVLLDEIKMADETELTPVILGWNYHNHKLGEIINNKYIVCGIMDSGAFFYDLRYNEIPIQMDDIVFEYINIDVMDEVDYSLLISDIKIIADDVKELYKINDYANKINMDRFKIIKDSEQINIFRDGEKKLLYYELYLLLCVSSLTSVLIYIYTYLKFKNVKKQIDLVYMIGAGYKELLISLLSEAVIHAVIISLIVFSLNRFWGIIISTAWYYVAALIMMYLGITCIVYINLFRKGERAK